MSILSKILDKMFSKNTFKILGDVLIQSIAASSLQDAITKYINSIINAYNIDDICKTMTEEQKTQAAKIAVATIVRKLGL